MLQNIVSDSEKFISDTSLAAPTFVAITALFNHHQVDHEQKQLGFLNPLLYQYTSNMFYEYNTTKLHAVIGSNRTYYD